MTDAENRPIRVSNDERSGPYIQLPVDRLEAVERVLKEHAIRYWVDRHQYSFNGRPPVTMLYINQKTDPNHVQALLDAA